MGASEAESYSSSFSSSSPLFAVAHTTVCSSALEISADDHVVKSPAIPLLSLVGLGEAEERGKLAIIAGPKVWLQGRRGIAYSWSQHNWLIIGST